MHLAINMSQSKHAFFTVLLFLSFGLCAYLFSGVPKYSSLQSIQGDVLNSYKKGFHGYRHTRHYRVLEIKSGSRLYTIRIPLIEGARVIRIGDVVSIMIEPTSGHTGFYLAWEVLVNDKLTISYEKISNNERMIELSSVFLAVLVASIASIYGLYCYRAKK